MHGERHKRIYSVIYMQARREGGTATNIFLKMTCRKLNFEGVTHLLHCLGAVKKMQENGPKLKFQVLVLHVHVKSSVLPPPPFYPTDYEFECLGQRGVFFFGFFFVMPVKILDKFAPPLKNNDVTCVIYVHIFINRVF